MYDTTVENSRKYTLTWHDAVTHQPMDLTAAVTFLSDLCQF